MAQQEGKPIWGESLLTPAEWKAERKKFPSVYNSDTPPAMFECDFKWRYRMGGTLTSQEIITINRRLDDVIKKAGIKLHEDAEATL